MENGVILFGCVLSIVSISYYYAPVIRRTVLEDLSLLAIRRTVQINGGNYCIFLEAKWRFALVMSVISTNQTTYQSYSQGYSVRAIGTGMCSLSY